MPALSYHFHLTPTDIWNMDGDVLEAYMDALDDLNQEDTRG